MSSTKFIRDPDSKAVLNTDTKKRREIEDARKRARKTASLEERVSRLESMVEELSKKIDGS